MSSFRLLGLAAEAESLRLQAAMRGMAWRAELIGAAALAGSACLVMLHVAAWHALVPAVAPHWAALVIAGADAVLLALLLLASTLRPGRHTERDAAALRDVALRQALRGGPLMAAITDLALARGGTASSLMQAALAAFHAVKR
jgi:hypothetical protein